MNELAEFRVFARYAHDKVTVRVPGNPSGTCPRVGGLASTRTAVGQWSVAVFLT